MPMQESQNNQTGDSTGQSAGETHLPILGLIENLEGACQPGVSPETFIKEILRSSVALSDAVYGAYWGIDPEARAPVVRAQLMPQVSKQGVEGWLRALSELAVGAMQQSIIRYSDIPEPADRMMTGANYIALAIPVRGDATITGAINIVVVKNNPILSDAGIALLRLVADFGLFFSNASSAKKFEDFYNSLSSAWDIIGEMLAFTCPFEMSQVLANRARVSLKADRVSVGLVKGNTKVKVVAISGEDIVDKRSNTVRAIQNAQTEVVVSGEAGFFSTQAKESEIAVQTARNPQHERLAKSREVHSVYSVPLRKEQDLVAVVTFEFSASPCDEGTRQIIDVTTGQVAPILHLSLENKRNFFKRSWDGIKKSAQWIFGKEHPWRKAAAVAVAALAAYAYFGTIEFKIAGNCALEPFRRHVYAAPFNSTIKAVMVKPGMRVKSGDTLVEFDREEIELKLRETRSELSSTRLDETIYRFSEQEIAKANAARARIEAKKARIALLQQQLSKATLKADTSGIVISGDFHQDVGRPVRTGEQLVEIAPLKKLVLLVEIDQGDIEYAKAGLKGRFTTKAAPDEHYDFTVSKVRPAPEIRNNKSVFIAEAIIENNISPVTKGGKKAGGEGERAPAANEKSKELRPGLEGAAKLYIGRRKFAWVMTRKIVNWVRLRLWW